MPCQGSAVHCTAVQDTEAHDVRPWQDMAYLHLLIFKVCILCVNSRLEVRAAMLPVKGSGNGRGLVFGSMAWQGMTWHAMPGQCSAVQCSAVQGRAGHGMTWQDMAGQGRASKAGQGRQDMHT